MPLTEPTRLVLAKTYIGTDDPDAAAYIAAVEAADEAASPGVGALETATKVAIHSFVKGCKADGIWPAIKASCILAGARTLSGALVPLVGPAPISVAFVTGDYNREAGLKGNGTSKIIRTNFTPSAANRDNIHAGTYVTEFITSGGVKGLLGNSSGGDLGETLIHLVDNGFRAQSNTSLVITSGTAPGLYAVNRSSSSSMSAVRASGAIVNGSISSQPQRNVQFAIFGNSATDLSNGRCGDWRLAFYSIGESLNLALLDSRVTDLINAIGAAIP